MSIDGFNPAAIQDVPLTAVHVPRDELGTEAVHAPAAAHAPGRAGRHIAAERHADRAGVGTADTSGKRRTAVEREGLYDS